MNTPLLQIISLLTSILVMYIAWLLIKLAFRCYYKYQNSKHICEFTLPLEHKGYKYMRCNHDSCTFVKPID
jgi:hypothetical protein